MSLLRLLNDNKDPWLKVLGARGVGGSTEAALQQLFVDGLISKLATGTLIQNNVEN
jgi:hypothetical protein